MPDLIESELNIVLVQRQTVNWAELSEQAFFQQSRQFCHLWGKPEDYVWRLFCLWNETFEMDYREVRQRLKIISGNNISQAGKVHFVPYQHYQNIPEGGKYYLFVDDDDWVAPDIGTKLLNYDDELLLWRSANIGSPNQEHAVFIWGMNGRCMTNNYAVSGKWLQPFSKIEQVIQHKHAEKIFHGREHIPHLDLALTVSNKTPISSVSLDRGLQGEMKPEKLRALVETYCERLSEVKEKELVYLPWVKPLLQENIALFDEVLRSRL